MIYFLYGTNKLAITEYIDNIIKKNNIDNINSFYMSETTIEDVLEDASYMDLFGSDKAVILYDTNLTLLKEEFIKYLDNPNDKTHLFLVYNEDKINEKSKIINILKEKTTFKSFPILKNKDLKSYVKEVLRNNEFTIEEDALTLFLNIINNNNDIVRNELNKLMNYKEDKIILYEDIKKVVSKVTEDNIFELVTAINKNDKASMFSLYKELIDSKVEPVVIVGFLYGQFKLYYKVKEMLNDGYNDVKIASLLKEHPYRIKLAIEEVRKYKSEKIVSIIEKLHEVDSDIKMGKKGKNEALETFFLEI